MTETNASTPASHQPLTREEKQLTAKLASRLWGGYQHIPGAIASAAYRAQARHLLYANVLMDLSSPGYALRSIQVCVPDEGKTMADVVVRGTGDHPLSSGSVAPTIENGRFVSIGSEPGPWWAAVREGVEWALAEFDKVDKAKAIADEQARAEREASRSADLAAAMSTTAQLTGA
jgi:hypothetical protein